MEFDTPALLAPDKQELTKPHLKCAIFKAYIEYIRQFYSIIDLEKIAQQAGLPLSYLQNEENWVSVLFEQRFMAALALVINDPDFIIKVGHYGVKKDVLGPAIHFLCTSLLPLSTVYQRLPLVTSFLNKLISLRVISNEKNHICYRLIPQTRRLNNHEISILADRLDDYVKSACGYYQAIPGQRYLPLAKVKFRKRQAQNALPEYIIDVIYPEESFTEKIKNIKRKLLPDNISAQYIEGSLEKMDLRYEELFTARTELQELASAFSQFVPFEIIAELGHQSPVNVRIGDFREVNRAILFSDIRMFSELCEQMAASDVLKFLNSYFGAITPIIKTHNGIIDKFIGDCVMAIFAKPIDALKAAVEIQRELVRYNLRHRSGKRRPIFAGIGLSYGPTIIGPVGVDRRLDITVVSDAVNVASRLDGLCKDLDAKILVSGFDFAELKNLSPEIKVIPHGKKILRGKKQPVEIVEIFDTRILDIFYEYSADESQEVFRSEYLSQHVRKFR